MPALPYGFVPVVPRVAVSAAPVFHHGDNPDQETLLSGELRLTLKTLTPLLIGHDRYRADQAKGQAPFEQGLVRQAAGRYRWVELAEASEPAAIGTEGRKRVSDWFRRPKETSEAPPSVSADWRTIAVTRRWQPVLLRPSIPARGRFAIIQYLADNRVLFWRLGWTASASEPGGALNTIGGD